jgi:hypothetical protein
VYVRVCVDGCICVYVCVWKVSSYRELVNLTARTHISRSERGAHAAFVTREIEQTLY